MAIDKADVRACKLMVVKLSDKDHGNDKFKELVTQADKYLAGEQEPSDQWKRYSQIKMMLDLVGPGGDHRHLE